MQKVLKSTYFLPPEILYIFAVLALDGQEQLSPDWGPAVGVGD